MFTAPPKVHTLHAHDLNRGVTGMDALARAPTYEYTTLNEIVGHLEERQVSQSSGAFRPRQYYPNIYLVALECSTVHQCRGGTGTLDWETNEACRDHMCGPYLGRYISFLLTGLHGNVPATTPTRPVSQQIGTAA